MDGRIPHLSAFQDIPDLGSDVVPDGSEWRIGDSSEGLGRDALDVARVVRGGMREGIGEVVRAVEELGGV